MAPGSRAGSGSDREVHYLLDPFRDCTLQLVQTKITLNVANLLAAASPPRLGREFPR